MKIPSDSFDLDVVLPVHNEGASIEQTLREFYTVVNSQDIRIRFVICEDGSSDNTVEVLTRLSNDLPILLITSKERKGYSKAVIDGFRVTTSPAVCFIDSDGQCDPHDFNAFWKELPKCDLVVGYRNPRTDHWVRLLMSFSFRVVYQMFFSIQVKDPSCPYLLLRKTNLDKILRGNVGILKQGFWWEFQARGKSLDFTITELPIKHRQRTSGTTQVYRPTKIPGIAIRHLLGLFQLKLELKTQGHLVKL